jgi:hypothetical protein
MQRSLSANESAQPENKYRKAGVLLSGLVPSDQFTTRMYDDTRWERFRRVIQRATHSSPHYTTRLSDIPLIH